MLPWLFLILYGRRMSGAWSVMSSLTLCAVFSLSLMAVACEREGGGGGGGGGGGRRGKDRGAGEGREKK